MARPVGPDGARSALLSVRVTPKLMFGLEMMSRLHRASIPDIVSRAIKDVFTSDFEGLWDYEDDAKTEPGLRRYLLDLLWAERPSDRFANIAFHCEYLMPTADVRLWSRIKSKAKFWQPDEPRTEANLLREALADDWAAINEEQRAQDAGK